MNQTNDIKPIMLSWPINIEYSILFIIFLSVLFLIYKYSNNKKVSIKQKQTNFWNVASIDIYLKELKLLEKNIKDKDFYAKLLSILRNILEYKGQKNISKMTFEEMNKLKINDNLKQVIKNIYFKEYAKEFEDSWKIRKELIEEVKKLIK